MVLSNGLPCQSFSLLFVLLLSLLASILFMMLGLASERVATVIDTARALSPSADSGFYGQFVHSYHSVSTSRVQDMLLDVGNGTLAPCYC